MNTMTEQVEKILKTNTPLSAWNTISHELLNATIPFAVHLDLFTKIYPNWQSQPNRAPLWQPEPTQLAKTHLGQLMQEQQITNFNALHRWSVDQFNEFWSVTLKKLAIQFVTPPTAICDLTHGIEHPQWFPNATLNIVESCFTANPNKIAIVSQKSQGALEKISYAELAALSNQIANSLTQQHFTQGDAIAIDMPMNAYAVAIYLGILKIGGIVVSIADSFSAEEIATRLRLSQAKGIFTQDVIERDGKKLPLYEKVVAANAPRAIVLAADQQVKCDIRANDIRWQDFLVENKIFTAVPCQPMSTCNILFSSGTTGDPKVIPWNHTTPIRAAADAYYHHDLNENDIIAWPTNLGWMMGPWLIFAGFINHATIALYDDVPRNRAFGQFIQDAQVTVLGVIPTLVAHWRQTACMEQLDWQRIKLFTSTGECSNPEDMFYLSYLAGYKPIIEYCGGTEIGGAYISSTLIENNYPSVFTTPTMGLDFVLLNEDGKPCENGEVALISPSIGLSTELLNADHHQLYFANMPLSATGKPLRRHGDQIQQFAEGGYCMLGRVDDTMNLGGIKVSSTEIERTLTGIEGIAETAAIAITREKFGPSLLVIYAATSQSLDKATIKNLMQKKINQHLNPLFKIEDVVFVKELPKTASNKIMRRVLRKEY